MSGYDDPGWDEAPRRAARPAKGGSKTPDLTNYIEVKERIQLFYEKYPDGRLTTKVIDLGDIDGKPRITLIAKAYRTVDDPIPGTGHSWLELPGKTPYTNGSEIENAETSAWGRAIAATGVAADRGIASMEEVRNKQQAEAPQTLMEAVVAAGGTPVPAETAQEAPTTPAAQESTTEALPDKADDTPADPDLRTDLKLPMPTGEPPAEPGITHAQLIANCKGAHILSAVISSAAREMFGTGRTLKVLTDQERLQLWAKLEADAQPKKD